jgi:FtsP/CotA-like multicopper oxidase with cupredoxin domain
MGRRRRSYYDDSSSNDSSTTDTTSSGSMDGGGMDGGDGGGMGGGGMGNACYVYPATPATPGRVTPDVSFNLSAFMNGAITMDDGRSVEIWGFNDDGGNMGMGGGGGGMGGMGGPFPSPAMRVRQGQIIHTNLSVNMMMVHTIHHHGIEPEYRSDGVGHLSWDVANGTYTYQWRPAHAGTYFYHCHTNTVLHAEMGMYGALIVDPPEGPGRAFENGPRYDVEAVWAADEIDSSWHTLPWDAGTCGGDVGLNELNPDYFVINGVDGAQSAWDAIATEMTRGQTLLARYICAGYHPQRISFGGLRAEVIASDGRPLPRSFNATSIEAHSAERYDLIFRPEERGTYEIKVEFLHWITRRVMGVARTRITVN